MTVIPFPTRAASFEPVSSKAGVRPEERALRLLLDPRASEAERPDPRGRRAATRELSPQAGEGLELPPLSDLLHALLELAEGERHKALVPVIGSPMEIALVRRGASALVSVYHTEASPSVISVDRRVPLRALIDATAAALAEQLEDERSETDPFARALERRLLARSEEAPIVPVDDDGRVASRVRGGAVDDPGQERPLAFGFDASIFPSQGDREDAVSHADVHAMLFGGQLWAWVRGRRIPVYQGPILLAAQRMLAACGGFVDAWREGRPAHVRLRTGTFTVALRGEKAESPSREAGHVSITLGSDESGVVTIPQLEIPSAARAILRLSSELLRALCAADRTQTKNLRVRTLRAEVRRISRAVREVSRAGSFENDDPDRLRLRARSETAAGDVSAPDLGGRPEPKRSATSLSWTGRWTASLASLDADQTHLSGSILVTSTEAGLVALDRDSGDALWQAPGKNSLVLVSPLGVLSAGERGELVHRDLFSGDVLFETRLGSKKSERAQGVLSGSIASGPAIPPTALLTEGREGISALDLRTGELRWRFTSTGQGTIKVERSGRALVVAGSDGAVSVLDVVSGQVLWRFADDVHAATTPAVVSDVVVLVSGEPGRGSHELLGLDLFSGKLLYRVDLPSAAELAPIAAGTHVLVAMKSGKNTALSAYDPRSGEELWSRSDPGVGSGAGLLAVDGKIFVNAPSGRLAALDLANGQTRWQRVLSAAESDDVPRLLTPILRSGALFVPSGTIHVLRPDDGASIGGRSEGGLPSDLVPDLVRIDERGWMYVGEESGHLVALAPQARLALVRPISS